MPSQCGHYGKNVWDYTHVNTGKTIIVRFVLATVEILHVQRN